MNLIQTLKNTLINYTYKNDVPIDNVFKALTFIIIIRTFFEILLGNKHSFEFNPDFYINIIAYIHIYISWLCLFLTISLLIKLFLKMKFSEALKIVLIFSPLILIPPLADFIFTKGAGGMILYSFEIDTFFYNYLNLFNPLAKISVVTPGVRIEILAAFLGSFYISFYFFKAGLLKSILLAMSIYTAIFFYGYLPAIYKTIGIDFYVLSGKAVTELTRSHKFFYMYLAPTVLILLSILIVLYKENKENFKTAISFLYPSRLFFYILLLVFGFIFVSNESGLYPQILNLEDSLKIFSSAISILFLFAHAKILNDIHDIEIDRVSNTERPLIKNTLSAESANQIKNILIIPSFLYALAAEISFIFYWFFIWAASHLYSATPFRLRRYYPLGHITLSLIGISVFLAGGSLVNSYEAYSALQKKEILLYIFLAFFLLSNIKDFKDTEGDKAGNVFNILNYIKPLKIIGTVFISGYAFSMYLIIKALNIVNTGTIVSLLIFSAFSIFYILLSKTFRKIERLILFSLIFSLYISAVWLYHITY